MSLAVQSLASQEPRAAMELVGKLPREQQRGLIPQLLEEWVKTDFSGATAFLESVEDPGIRSSMLESIAEAYSHRNIDAALRWAAKLPWGETQAVTANIISRLGARDPARASSLLNTIADVSQRQLAAVTVANVWSRQDPAAALAWVQRLPADSFGINVASAVFNTWAYDDLPDAIQQIGQLSNKTLRDAAAASIVINHPSLAQDIAEQLFVRIETAQMRSAAARILYYKYRASDPALAERYRKEIGATEKPANQR